MSDIPSVLAGFKDALEPLDVEIYDFVPDNPVLPSVVVYVEQWPYDGSDATFVLWCLAGKVDTQGAQATLMGWLSETGTASLPALIDASHNLSGSCSSVIPFETRNWGIVALQDGRRVLQGELVCHVLR